VIDSAGIARVLRCRCAEWCAHGKTCSSFRFLGGWDAEDVLMDFFFGTVRNAQRFRREVAPVRTAAHFFIIRSDRPAGTGAAPAHTVFVSSWLNDSPAPSDP